MRFTIRWATWLDIGSTIVILGEAAFRAQAWGDVNVIEVPRALQFTRGVGFLVIDGRDTPLTYSDLHLQLTRRQVHDTLEAAICEARLLTISEYKPCGSGAAPLS